MTPTTLIVEWLKEHGFHVIPEYTWDENNSRFPTVVGGQIVFNRTLRGDPIIIHIRRYKVYIGTAFYPVGDISNPAFFMHLEEWITDV